MADCAAIVLAAGSSTRLGQPKQLICIAGETLLRRTVRLAIQAGCAPVFVILGRDADAFSLEVEDPNATVIVNHGWQTGMASSLRCGLRAMLGANPHQKSVMVLVCDQPKLNLPLLQRLLEVHSSQQELMTASHYHETLGVPAIFSDRIFAELLQLTGDQGARRVLRRHLKDVASVDFLGGEFDLDTPEDVARLQN